MSTNRKILSRGIKYLAFALPMLFIGPGIIHSSFKNQEHSLYWLVLSIGIIVCCAGVYLTYLGLKTVVKSIFENNNQ